jgi:hypothetical protein
LHTALSPGIEPEDALTEDAAILLAARLKTPLQIGRHLVRAFEAGFGASVKPIDAATIEGVLSRQIDDLEAPCTQSREVTPWFVIGVRYSRRYA